MSKTLRSWWNQYKYRFVPWIAFNLKERSMRSVAQGSKDKLLTDRSALEVLTRFFQALCDGSFSGSSPLGSQAGRSLRDKSSNDHENSHNQANVIPLTEQYGQCPNIRSHKHSHRVIESDMVMMGACAIDSFLNGKEKERISHHDNHDLRALPTRTFFGTSVPPSPYDQEKLSTRRIPEKEQYKKNLDVMKDFFGFCIERKPSSIDGGGTGVVVTTGYLKKGQVVAMYPGLIYYPYEPVLLQSIGNPFVFRCVDGILLDGNDKAISKVFFRSCAGRDRVGPYEMADTAWLTPFPKNPLAIGQYVNNQGKDRPANVAYQEINIPAEFPIHLRQYIPNAFYSPQNPDLQRFVRAVVLVSLRDIAEGEELFSSYFTVVF